MEAYITLSSKCLNDKMKIVIDDITFYASDTFMVEDLAVSANDDNCGCIHLDFTEQNYTVDCDKVTIRLKDCSPWVSRGTEIVCFDEGIIEDKFKDGMFDTICPYVTVHDQEVTIEDFKVTDLVIHANGSRFEPNFEKMCVEV